MKYPSSESIETASLQQGGIRHRHESVAHIPPKLPLHKSECLSKKPSHKICSSQNPHPLLCRLLSQGGPRGYPEPASHSDLSFQCIMEQGREVFAIAGHEAVRTGRQIIAAPSQGN